MHNPELIILDEPANGLDPAGIVEIRNLLINLAHEQGVTVFMSSHILGEVSRLAHRIGIIHQGRLLQELDVDELERNRRRRLLIRARDCQAARAVLIAAGFSTELSADGTIEIKDIAAIERPDEIATRLVNAGHAPTMLNVEQEDLEHYFLRLVGVKHGTAKTPHCPGNARPGRSRIFFLGVLCVFAVRRFLSMNNLFQSIWVEFLKARRSKMPLFTALGFAMVPFGGGFFMIVLKDPELARRVGLISDKARLTMGAADWPTYLRFLRWRLARAALFFSVSSPLGVWSRVF